MRSADRGARARGGRAELGGDDRVKSPRARNALQLVLAAILKRDSRPNDEILDGV